MPRPLQNKDTQLLQKHDNRSVQFMVSFTTGVPADPSKLCIRMPMDVWGGIFQQLFPNLHVTF